MAAARPCKLLLALAAAAQATRWGGIRNQGNTCYLNSLLQTLFHVPALRSDVLGRPAEPRGLMKRLRTAPRPARALADVFKRLAQNATAQTRGLTRALGVSGLQQQDAQEYLRLLVGELLEDAALGDRVRSCYEGRAENFLEATDAEAKSARRVGAGDVIGRGALMTRRAVRTDTQRFRGASEGAAATLRGRRERASFRY